MISEAVMRARSFSCACAGVFSILLFLLPLSASAAPLEAVAAGTVLRLRAKPPGGPWIVGRLVRLGDGRLVLSTKTTEREFSIVDLLGLEANIDNRSRAGRGALYGSLAGITIGLVVGGATRTEGNFFFPSRDNAVPGAILGGLVGLVAGGLVGANFRGWETVSHHGAVGFGIGENPAAGAVMLTYSW